MPSSGRRQATAGTSQTAPDGHARGGYRSRPPAPGPRLERDSGLGEDIGLGTDAERVTVKGNDHRAIVFPQLAVTAARVNDREAFSFQEP